MSVNTPNIPRIIITKGENGTTNDDVKKHRKKSRKPRPEVIPIETTKENGEALGYGLKAMLKTLNEDITIIPREQRAVERSSKTKLASEPSKVRVPVGDQDDWDEEFPIGDDRHTIYIEKCAGFRAEQQTNRQRQPPSEEGKLDEFVVVQSDEHTRLEEQCNEGVRFALGAYKFSRITGLVLFGLLAGASLAQTLFVQSFSGTISLDRNRVVSVQSDDGLIMITRYGLYAEASSIAFYIAFVIATTCVLDRNDLARPTGSCMLRCVTFGNGAVAVIFALIAFAIHNTMFWFTNVIYELAHIPSNLLADQFVQNPAYAYVLSVWRVLDACRTAFVLATWLVLGCSLSGRDRMIETLRAGPGEPTAEQTPRSGRMRLR